MADERIEQLEKRNAILAAGIEEFEKEIADCENKIQRIRLMVNAARGLIEDSNSWIERIKKEKEEKGKNNKK
jgi:uncharacterized coiled-coil protein SlyX